MALSPSDVVVYSSATVVAGSKRSSRSLSQLSSHPSLNLSFFMLLGLSVCRILKDRTLKAPWSSINLCSLEWTERFQRSSCVWWQMIPYPERRPLSILAYHGFHGSVLQCRRVSKINTILRCKVAHTQEVLAVLIELACFLRLGVWLSIQRSIQYNPADIHPQIVNPKTWAEVTYFC